MSTIEPAEAVTRRLENTWVNWWTYSLWTGLALATTLSLGTLGLFALIDALAHLPRAGLGVLFTVWVGVSLAAFGMLFVRLLRFQRTLPATARRLELECPELGSHLINLVQLSAAGPGADPFRQAAVARAANAVAEVPFERAGDRTTRRRRRALCMQTPRDLLEAATALGAVLTLAVLASVAVPGWANGSRRLLNPWSFVPATGSVGLVTVTPGDVERLVGSSLEVAARVAKPPGRPVPATLFVLPDDGGPEVALTMHPDRDGATYHAALPQVLVSSRYRVEVGDSQSDRYRVTVYQKPTVAEVSVSYEYPAYLARPKRTVTRPTADLEGPLATRATLRIRPSSPIARGYLMFGTEKLPARVRDDGQTLEAEVVLTESGPFTIHLETLGGHADPEPRVNRVQVETDAPPAVQIVEPSRAASAAAGGTVQVVVRASDDNGLGRVRLELQAGDDPPVETVADWSSFPEPTGATLVHPLRLDPKRFRPGQALRVRAVAADRRDLDTPAGHLGPQESASTWLALTVLDPAKTSSESLARLDAVRAKLARILREQVEARVLVAGVPRAATLAEARPTALDVRGRQVAIQKATAALVGNVADAAAEPDAERQTIKRVLNTLAFGAMVAAVRQAEALANTERLADLPAPAAALAATQDRVIDVLKRLLNELRKETAETLADMKKRPDSTLPPDVRDKLRALESKLDEFLKQQKKVIEATENLAKTPVDDFTEKDLKALKDLAATEDDWSRFMADTRSDLSKLPEQDFSNPTLLKELVAVENELKMAKDALTKKTADIAVPLEQLGAEMAKEMTTNIEKWLPDTPDRERWSQEEPLTDDMKNAPLAELPSELEDLVGDLMEEEEDLFDEMEDASSSWADSIDKGAGWDAMDGPISNNSARGVTGNRLPNSSEIAGRSGEGRQGKASGEFVSDTAVGKGGRKTPSRLTPDAFVKGQVQDTSKDPVGGATGGGKQSGLGGAGLQGPVPDRPELQMARLASKQAELRNKTEAVDLKFQVMKYHHADLSRLIAQMAAVETDLRSGLYRNALRRRDVLLDGLTQVRMGARGEALVRKDQTANLPADIQKEILGQMREPHPAGWEELNRRYFERLAAPSSSPSPSPK